MDSNQLDIELYTKIKETFKIVLKKEDTDISFDEPNIEDNVSEITNIINKNHNFILLKKYEESNLLNINSKYYSLISSDVKAELRFLNFYDKIEYLNKKTWYLKILKPIYGNIFNISIETSDVYRFSYNGIVTDITKIEYDRFLYYTHYVYKLQQLRKLNKELDINQDFSIIFDDDKVAHDLYRDMYENFKGIINNFNDDIDESIDDID